MFILQSVVLIFAVFTAPAIALRPQLILKPVEATFIPIFSLALIFIAQLVLSRLGLYETTYVKLISALTATLALYRLTITLKTGTGQSYWDTYSLGVFIISISLAIYVGGRLASHGFIQDDEIYSWNMWAVQHYLGESVDYYYTSAPYPQLFPKILSFCYMVLGGVEYQAAVKTSLIVLPLVTLAAIGLAGQNRGVRSLLLFSVLALYCISGLGMKSIFGNGMPDGLMTTSVVISALFLTKYWDNNYNNEYLFYSAISASLALLTKQPGLVWSALSFPLLFLAGQKRNNQPLRNLHIALLPLALAAIWLLTEGKSFQNNSGVTSRSFANRDMLDQLAYSANEWLVTTPVILIAVIAAAALTIKAKKGVEIFLLFVIPSMIFWFLFATYDLRAGTAALMISVFLISYTDFGLNVKKPHPDWSLFSRKLVFTALALLLTISIYDANKRVQSQSKDLPNYAIGNSQKNNIYALFGNDAGIIFDQVLNKNSTNLWTPTNYVYGIFYSQVNVYRPSKSRTYNADSLLTELRSIDADYISDGGRVPFTAISPALNLLKTEICPDLFERISGPDNDLKISFYKINKTLLHSKRCNI